MVQTGHAPASGAPARRRNTPTRLWAALAGAVAATLALAVVCAVTTGAAQSAARHTSGPVENLVVQVHELYYSLADADAESAAAILVGTVPPKALTDAYNGDVAQAEAALGAASRDVAGDDTASAQLAEVAAQLPTYTELVGKALADNRFGYPIGAAYLRNASVLLRETMLPEVSAVATLETAAEQGGQGRVAGFPWWVLLAAAAAGGALWWIWRELDRSTRRRVNPGLAAGALISAGLLVWTLAASLSAAGSVRSADVDFTRVNALMQARSDLSRAASDQALTLVERGEDGGAAARDETSALDAILSGGALDGHMHALWSAVRADSETIAAQTANGDYPAAVASVAGRGGSHGLSGDVAAFNQALLTGYQAAQASYTKHGDATAGALSGGLWGGLIAGIVAAAAAAYGINRRLAEYR